MKYQSLILAAGIDNTFQTLGLSNSKCRFEVQKDEDLLTRALRTYSSPERTIIALNSDDFQYFEGRFQFHDTYLLEIKRKTQGALATCGMALDLLDENAPILVAPVDGILAGVKEVFLEEMIASNADGGVVVFPSDKEIYSYVRVHQGKVVEFAEKSRIGVLATSGIYYFKSKKILADSILWAILNRIHYSNLYYLSSTMNKLIYEDQKVELFQVGEDEYFRFASPAEATTEKIRMKGFLNDQG